MDTQDKMTETEVSLRLAFYIIDQGLASSDVQVAIDGAQVKIMDTIQFDIREFLRGQGWIKQTADTRWQGSCAHACHQTKIIVHSNSGRGDVQADLVDGRTLRVECKKGSLVRSKSSPDYRLLREGLGQILTTDDIGEHDLLAVAVPGSPKLKELADRWRRAPLIDRLGICILTVSREHQVLGLPTFAASQDDLDRASNRT